MHGDVYLRFCLYGTQFEFQDNRLSPIHFEGNMIKDNNLLPKRLERNTI